MVNQWVSLWDAVETQTTDNRPWGGVTGKKLENRILPRRNPEAVGGGVTEEHKNQSSAWPWLGNLATPRRAKRAAEKSIQAAENEGNP